MIPLPIRYLIVAAGGLGLGLSIPSWLPKPPDFSQAIPDGNVKPAAGATPTASLGEVTDLIDRLKTVADNPNGEWYRNGISVTFTGRDVEIKLKTRNGNEYNARARQLKDAVAMIADPAPDVRSALKGFDAEAARTK